MSQNDGLHPLPPTGINIPSEIRLYVMTLLQQTLVCTVDLQSQVKQASWNVKGRDFGLLHSLFATMATELEAYADLLAERLVTLGGVAQGTIRIAALQSTLPEYPAVLMDGLAHVRALAERFAPYATALRDNITQRTPLMSRMPAVRRSTRISRVGLINTCGCWNRTSNPKSIGSLQSIWPTCWMPVRQRLLHGVHVDGSYTRCQSFACSKETALWQRMLSLPNSQSRSRLALSSWAS